MGISRRSREKQLKTYSLPDGQLEVFEILNV